jgi:hypothetical protein
MNMAKSMKRNVISFQGVLGAASVTMLIGVELLSAAAAIVWALSGSLRLGSTSSIVLSVIVGIPCLVVLIKVAIMAVESEMELKAVPQKPGFDQD